MRGEGFLLFDLIALIPYLIALSPFFLLYAWVADKLATRRANAPLSEGEKRRAGEARYQGAVDRLKAGNPTVDDLYRIAHNDRSYE